MTIFVIGFLVGAFLTVGFYELIISLHGWGE
jgi:hypothetical protein